MFPLSDTDDQTPLVNNSSRSSGIRNRHERIWGLPDLTKNSSSQPINPLGVEASVSNEVPGDRIIFQHSPIHQRCYTSSSTGEFNIPHSPQYPTKTRQLRRETHAILDGAFDANLSAMYGDQSAHATCFPNESVPPYSSTMDNAIAKIEGFIAKVNNTFKAESSRPDPNTSRYETDAEKSPAISDSRTTDTIPTRKSRGNIQNYVGNSHVRGMRETFHTFLQDARSELSDCLKRMREEFDRYMSELRADRTGFGHLPASSSPEWPCTECRHRAGHMDYYPRLFRDEELQSWSAEWGWRESGDAGASYQAQRGSFTSAMGDGDMTGSSQQALRMDHPGHNKHSIFSTYHTFFPQFSSSNLEKEEEEEKGVANDKEGGAVYCEPSEEVCYPNPIEESDQQDEVGDDYKDCWNESKLEDSIVSAVAYPQLESEGWDVVSSESGEDNDGFGW